MKLLKRILMIFIWIILILLVTFNLYNFVSINLLHKELPKIFGYSVLEVVSGSMEPTIMIGDLIVIDTDCEEYHEGDIITFRDVNGAFVTHRIIEIDTDEMITKGDANDSLDEAMSPTAIVGKYVTRIPQLGSVMSSLKNPLVMALILAIGIIICFLVSTDKDLKPRLTDEEKEFLEFKKQKAMKEELKKEEKIEESEISIDKPVVEVAEISNEVIETIQEVNEEERVDQEVVVEETHEVIDLDNQEKSDNTVKEENPEIEGVPAVSVKKNVNSPSKKRTIYTKKYYNNSRTSNNRSNNRYHSQKKNNNSGANKTKTQGNYRNNGKNNNYTQRKNTNASGRNQTFNKNSKRANYIQQKNKARTNVKKDNTGNK